MRQIIAFLILLLALPAAAPARAQEAITFERTEIAIVTAGGARHAFKAEWAKTEAQKARGLMYRTAMPLDHGMLLDYDPPGPASIWMRNTLIGLDIIFIRADGTIESIFFGAKPRDETSMPSKGNVRAVLEVNAGVARLLGIQPGDKVEHPIFTAR